MPAPRLATIPGPTPPVDLAVATEPCARCGAAVGVACRVVIFGRAHDGAHRERLDAALPRPPATPWPGRIVVDFAEPTLRAIHDVLLERICADAEGSVAVDALVLIAEQMVAAALTNGCVPDPEV